MTIKTTCPICGGTVTVICDKCGRTDWEIALECERKDRINMDYMDQQQEISNESE